eukprot:TRINITY_DN13688_c0_g1_i2.p2 TRINITY_DN13688_c0_g1~~TRINITY_DN13688_c0_g1_i2.p2  ORF type:complete len:155 (+),score=20.28 TRINITY_DN13688_c0_g1_i2:119-583(+)
MIRRPPRSTHCISSAASDVYKRQYQRRVHGINPYTGQIYPEPGPNMIWNEKYSTMMMGGSFRYNANATYTATVNQTEAVKIADDFVKSQLGESYSVPGEGHAFYGYYTFHIKKDDKVIGMLSVNDLTGEVWNHDWHGELEQVISEHQQKGEQTK